MELESIVAPVNEENKRYLETKRDRMGHIFTDEDLALDEENVQMEASE